VTSPAPPAPPLSRPDSSGRIRRTIAALPGSKIAEIAAMGLGDPSVIGLWYGEGDLATPGFIVDAADRALRAGHTF